MVSHVVIYTTRALLQMTTASAERACQESFQQLHEDLHYSLVYSNVVYIIAALLAFQRLPGLWRSYGALLLLTALASFVHHSNVPLSGFSSQFWGLLDGTLASSTAILGGAGLLYFWFKGCADTVLALTALSIGIMALSLFALSNVLRGRLAASGNEPGDVVQGFVGGLAKAAAPDPVLRATVARWRGLYGSYHASWHLVSGLGVLLALAALRFGSEGCHVSLPHSAVTSKSRSSTAMGRSQLGSDEDWERGVASA